MPDRWYFVPINRLLVLLVCLPNLLIHLSLLWHPPEIRVELGDGLLATNNGSGVDSVRWHLHREEACLGSRASVISPERVDGKSSKCIKLLVCHIVILEPIELCPRRGRHCDFAVEW